MMHSYYNGQKNAEKNTFLNILSEDSIKLLTGYIIP